MTRERHDDPLSAAFAGLERARASSGFTRRTLARLDEAGRPGHRRRRVAPWVWAATAVALAVATLLLAPAPEPERPDLAAEAGELRRRHRELASELAALEALDAASAPVLVLDSRPDYDLVLDLRPLLDGTTGIPGPRPAALDGGRPGDAGHAIQQRPRRP